MERAVPADRPLYSLEALQQWEDHGASWRAVEVGEQHAIIELCTCYGEPVDVVRGEAPELIEYVRAHRDDA